MLPCSRATSRGVALALVLLLNIPMRGIAADKASKARQTEAKRLLGLGKAAEKQGHLLDARAQYLASEHVLFSTDAEKALEHIAETADHQVKTLMESAARAYGAEQFAAAAQSLESAQQLHPGSLAIGCNLGLTRFQQGQRDDALALLDECVTTIRDQDTRRHFAELFTALSTGDRRVTVPPSGRPQVIKLNEAILREANDESSEDADGDAPAKLSTAAVCGQVKQVQGGLPGNPAMIFDRAKCAESEGRLEDAIALLVEYSKAAPGAYDLDETQARLVTLKALAALPEPKGSLVRAEYMTAAKCLDDRQYDQAIAHYEKADAAIPEFVETRRRIATLLEAQGQVDRAKQYWRLVLTADEGPDGAAQTQRALDGLDTEKGQYDELVGGARQILRDLIARSLLEGQPVGRIYAAYRLQLANAQLQSAAGLLPLASEGNLLQAFTCSQMNDFRCVRESLDAQRSLALPVSFYGAVFYKGMDPSKRAEQERAYGKFEFEPGTVRFAQISTVKPKKRTATAASPGAGEDGLGRLGAADGLRRAGFQGFTVRAASIKHLETQNGILYLEVDDKSIKHRKMLIEPLSFVLEVPPQGPGARRYMNNYISIAETYGGVARVKLGKESTTAGEKLKMVYNIASIGMSVTSIMFGDFSSAIDVATGVHRLARNIGLSERQVRRLVLEREQVVRGVPFKAIPTEPVSLAFRTDLK